MDERKKGYLKIHIAVDVKSKEILAIKVTDDEHVYNSKPFPELANEIVKSNKIIGKLLFADDGTYEGNDIFRYLSADNGILPCIKVRKNAKIKLKDGNFIRNLSVISQKKDLQKWKEVALLLAMDKDGLL